MLRTRCIPTRLVARFCESAQHISWAAYSVICSAPHITDICCFVTISLFHVPKGSQIGPPSKGFPETNSTGFRAAGKRRAERGKNPCIISHRKLPNKMGAETPPSGGTRWPPLPHLLFHHAEIPPRTTATFRAIVVAPEQISRARAPLDRLRVPGNPPSQPFAAWLLACGGLRRRSLVGFCSWRGADSQRRDCTIYLPEDWVVLDGQDGCASPRRLPDRGTEGVTKVFTNCSKAKDCTNKTARSTVICANRCGESKLHRVKTPIVRIQSVNAKLAGGDPRLRRCDSL